VFVDFGLLVGPKVLDGIDLSSSSETVRALAETTRALVLFAEASRSVIDAAPGWYSGVLWPISVEVAFGETPA
jgi:hypothetical protein